MEPRPIAAMVTSVFEEQLKSAEEELRKKKEIAMKGYFEQILHREQDTSAFNRRKLLTKWRAIMRQIKIQKLRTDVQILSHVFSKIIEKKNEIIVSLARDIHEAEMQHVMAFQTHLMIIDGLADLQRQRIEALSHETEDEANLIKQEFDAEREQILQHGRDETNYLFDVIIAMNLKAQEEEYEGMCVFTGEKTDTKQSYIKMKQILRLQIETKVEELWSQLRHDLELYLDQTSERKQSFAIIKAKEMEYVKEIAMRSRKIEQLKSDLAAVKKKLRSNSNDLEDRLRPLRSKLQDLYKTYIEFREKVYKCSRSNAERLAKLCAESHAAMKEMKRQIVKGQKILQKGEICRKWETADEKVRPFFVSTLTPQDQLDIASVLNDPPTEPFAHVMYDYQTLENFWKRFNKVLLDKVALTKEKKDLQKENNHLRMLLKSYLNNITVSPQVIAKPNSLFIVSNEEDTKTLDMYAPKQQEQDGQQQERWRPQRAFPNVIEGALLDKAKLR